MFRQARIKLTLWYSAIIMAISLFFSLIIYRGATFELRRIETVQRLRRPIPFGTVLEPEIVEETEQRIIFGLIFLNGMILMVSAAAGYFMAGRTLEPIRKNMEDQKDFVANASHELRTPLTSLKTEIEVALREKRLPPAQTKALLKSNLEEVNKMQRLANYLLTLNKYDNRTLPMTKVDLKDVVKEATRKMKVETDLKKLSVTGNKESLIELVTILLDNAFKYNKKSGKIRVRTKRDGILEVQDEGIGISKEDLPHIFDKFYRSDKSRGTEGYGLGLSIAKSIADLHGAKIEVESEKGKGSIFKLIFSSFR